MDESAVSNLPDVLFSTPDIGKRLAPVPFCGSALGKDYGRSLSMRLYMAAPAEYAAAVVEAGFSTGRPFYDPAIDGFSRTSHMEYCDFRDKKPSRTSLPGLSHMPAINVFGVRVEGPIRLDDPGDFVLSIDVPDDFVFGCEVGPDHPSCREFWLTPKEANRFLATLRVYDSEYGGLVRRDLVGK
jgi:hypothetical protein